MGDVSVEVGFPCPRCGHALTLPTDELPVEVLCPDCGQTMTGKVATRQDLERSLARALEAGVDPAEVQATREWLVDFPDEQ
jgi:predicted RNA-binding Zn-ribbon protein involved in translation (DUF1610 family)